MKSTTQDKSKPTKPPTVWKDETSYSRDQPRIPHVWSLDLGELRVTITDNHRDNPGKWQVSCHRLDVIDKELRAATLEQAKAEAVIHCIVTVNKLAKCLVEASSVIHFMRHGVTMCGISEVPGDWKNNDRWAGDPEHVTCPWCLRVMEKEQKFVEMTHQEYLVYLDSLQGMARYPYTTVVTNPPDTLNEYRRPFTAEEYAKLEPKPTRGTR